MTEGAVDGAPSRAWLPPVGRRQLLTFAALAILLLVPWPGVGRAFAAVFAAYGTGVVRVLGIGGDPAPSLGLPAPGEIANAEGGEWAVLLRTDPTAAGVPLDTRIFGFTPFAIFLALALATAVPRRRKLVVLAAGLGLLWLRLAVAIALPVARSSGVAPAGGLPSASELVWWTLFAPPVMSYAAPLFVWFLVVAATTPRPAKAGGPARRIVTQNSRRHRAHKR